MIVTERFAYPTVEGYTILLTYDNGMHTPTNFRQHKYDTKPMQLSELFYNINHVVIGQENFLHFKNGNYIKFKFIREYTSGIGLTDEYEFNFYTSENAVIPTKYGRTSNQNATWFPLLKLSHGSIYDVSTNALGYIHETVGSNYDHYLLITYILFDETYAFPMTTEIPGNVEIYRMNDIFSDAQPYNPSNPNEQGGNSVVGGGDGTFEIEGDDVPIVDLPNISANSAGFVSIYTPTLIQLQKLSNYMWSDLFDIATFKKLFADPMDAILGLSVLPFQIPTSGTSTVKVGGIDTGITMNVATGQYMSIDCGSITIKKFWGSALDFSPYTKFSVYLPCIGTRELNADDVMGKTIQIVYNIDVLSGTCAALIKCDNAVMYQFSGSCAAPIPVTGQNWTSAITATIQLAGSGLSAVATGGATLGQTVTTAVSTATALKPAVQRSGAVSGAAGLLGIQKPYLIIEFPRQSLAAGYNKFVGYPSNITDTLSNLSGYTEIESIHLENIPATDTELQEIETLLKTGVIL